MGGKPIWLDTKFENAKLELARIFAIALLSRKTYSRSTLADCYYSLSSNEERKEISESWINLLWSRIKQIQPKKWRHALASDQLFIKFVYGFWGKEI